MSLYSLTNDYAALSAMESDEAVINTLDAIDQQIDEKVHNICMVIKNNAAMEAGIRDEAKRLKARADSLDNENKRLREYILSSMVKTGKPKIKTAFFSVNVLAGKESLKIADPKMVPKKYQTITIGADNAKIKKLLQSGKKVKGAKLITGNPSLTIK